MTEFDKLSIEDFVKELGSASPAPGGGSTAALAGALACSLIGMVAKITLKKKVASNAQNKLEKIVTASEGARDQFLKLITSDTLAFNEIMKSYKLPKSTDFEKDARFSSIQASTKHAADVPLQTAKLGLQTLEWVKELTEYGSENAITDTGVAGLMARSAIQGAIWNVQINLGSIKDNMFVQKTKDEVEKILTKTNNLWPEIQKQIKDKID